MALSQEQLMKMYGMGALGGGVGGLFGGNKNPADKANPYLDRIPGEAGKYYDPYIGAGKGALDVLPGQYSGLLNDPGGKMNDIGASYKQSPGFQFALEQALGAGNRSAAAGGMAGSPMNQQMNMQTATDMASQDYNDWMKMALGLYGEGLGGEQGLAQLGQQSAQSKSDLIAQALAQQAAYQYQGQAAKNASNPWGNIGAGIGMLGGGIFGGPFGAAAGASAGKAIGGG